MVTSPSAIGVNVAVYTVDEVALNELKAPLVKVLSPTTKLLVAPLAVNVSDIVSSLDVNASNSSAVVMVMVGPVVS